MTFRRHLVRVLLMVLVSALMALGIGACATGYQSVGFSGGFSETQLDENVFRVSFHGNGYTSRERARDFTLLRSAEISVQHGYPYFVILDEESYTKHSSYKMPTQTHTTATVTASGNVAYGSADTLTTGGQTIHFAKPRTTNTIYLLKEKPDDGTFAYNAGFLSRSLRAKHGIANEYGQGTTTYADGGKYVGEFRNGLLNGQGTYTFASGNKYVGEFKDDNRNGQGTFTFANGDKYVGEFKDENFHGHGTYTFANGEKHVGEFKDGLANGQGTITYANGDKYVGEFRDNKKHGQGTLTRADGEKYIGKWKNGKQHGQGTSTAADGKTQSGEWRDGEFQGN